jgi:hypothetical protein
MADDILFHDFDDGFERIIGSRTPEQGAEAKTNGHLRELPQLVITPGNLPAVVDTLGKLFAADGRFMSNGNRPVTVIIEDGSPKIVEVTSDVVRMHTRHVRCPVKPGERRDEYINVTLSRDVAQLYLYGLLNKGLKTIRGVCSAPLLEDDGSIRIIEGYDEKSGLYCHNVPQVAISDHPNEIDAAEALFRLRDRFKTFSFDDSVRIKEGAVSVTDLSGRNIGLDESTFLVLLLTAVVRQSIALAPAGLLGAPRLSGSGTGKGLLVKCIIIIATGVCPPAFTAGHDREELEKRLVAVLVEGRPANFLDNFNAQELRSDTLASALTEDPAMVRVMGQTKNVPLHTRTFLGITGNGIQISEDLARRVLKVHLNARVESPEQRNFDKGTDGFIAQILADRARLLSDALTIWRWGRQNELRRGRPFGNYEKWSRWCRDPLLTLGCRDPIDRVADIKAADPERARLTEIFDKWRQLHGREELKASALNEVVLQLIDENASRRDGVFRYSRNHVASFLA